MKKPKRKAAKPAVTYAMTVENAKQDTPPSPPPTNWISLEWNKPPIGKVVLFFVMGKVMAGFCSYDPLGRLRYGAFADATDQSYPNLPNEAFTHWRYLPSEKP